MVLDTFHDANDGTRRVIGGGVAVVGGSVVVGTDRCGYFELISVS